MEMNTNCSLFTTNGSAAASYSYYRFYDFRNIPDDGTSNTSSSSSSSSSSNPLPSTSTVPIAKTVNDASWQNDWELDHGLVRGVDASASLTVEYSRDNVRIETYHDPNPNGASYLSLSTSRSANQSQTQQASEMLYAEQNVTHLSLRVLAYVAGAPGAVAAMFTYRSATQESDVEVLTRDPSSSLHLTNQPSERHEDDATFNVSLPGRGSWTDWHVYRLDWVEGRTVWAVDGVEVADTDVNVPVVESTVIINMWGDGGEWSGLMAEGGKAVMLLRWVEMAYNATVAPSDDAGGRLMMCSVDEVVGAPAPLNTGVRRTVPTGRCMLVGWMVTLFVAVIS